MPDELSRYHDVGVARVTIAGADGETRTVAHLRRRFPPPPGTGAVLTRHRVVEGDRLDRLAARYLGDPTLFWRICDANGADRPDDLTAEPGRAIDITAEGL